MNRYHIERDAHGLPTRMHWISPRLAAAELEDDLAAWARWHKTPTPTPIWFRAGIASSSRACLGQPDAHQGVE